MGHFRIEQAIGAGGAGSVFAAQDLEIPGRRVAFKLIHAGGLTPDIEALRREAAALAALQHPHILVVHEIGDSKWGPFLVTELMTGGSLMKRLEAGPVALDEALRLGRAIADALRAAHQRGLLHRDIKPANVLLAEDGTVKVADFGLAWRRVASGTPVTSDPSTPSDPNLGAPISAGTPYYLAPEVLERAAPTEMADQFAFGVTLHQILTGRRPFEGPDWIRQALAGEPEIDPGLPSDLSALIRRSIARHPEARYPDMVAVVAALDRARERRDPKRRRLRLALAGASILIAALVIGGLAHRQLQTRRARALNEEGRAALERGDRNAARRAFLEAHGADTRYLPACANLGTLAAREDNPTWAVTILEECARTFPASEVTHYNLGTALRLTGAADRAERELRLALGSESRGALRPLVLNELALLLLDQKRPGDALALLREAGVVAESPAAQAADGAGADVTGDPAPAGTVEEAILAKTAGLAFSQAGRPGDAARALRRALSGPLPAHQRGPALLALGRALEAGGDFVGAIEAYSEALLVESDAATQDEVRQGLSRLQEGSSDGR